MTTKRWIGAAIGTVGLALIIWPTSWTCGLGVFLMLFGNNLERDE